MKLSEFDFYTLIFQGKNIQIANFPFLGDFFFFLIAAPEAYGSSQARDWIQATAATYTPAVAMWDPLTHCAGLGIKPTPSQWPEPWQLDS